MEKMREQYRMVLNEEHYDLYRQPFNSYGKKINSDSASFRTDQRTTLDWRKTDCDKMKWTELTRDNVHWQVLVAAVLDT